MKKSISKITALLLVLMMLFSLGGCGKKASIDTGTASSAVSTAAESTTAEGSVKLPIADAPVTLTILTTSLTSTTISNDLPTFKELEKRTNVHLEWTLLPASGAADKFNLIMLSGNLPDLINYTDMTVCYKYAMQGAFVPLEDLIKQYAPHFQAILDNPPFPIPNIKAELSAGDGHIYAFPQFSDDYMGEVYYVREDWLKKLNLKIPATTDEYYGMLKAFKENDPNGNNQKDEIPFCCDHHRVADLRALMNAFGVHKGFYVAKDQTIKFGPADDKDRQLEALNWIKKLYDEGLIDPEFSTTKSDQFKSKASSDKVGAMYCWSQSGAINANNILKKEDPNKKFVPMLPVKGPYGDQFKEDPQPLMIQKLLISKDNKNIETTMKWIDYCYSDEGNLLNLFGIEDSTYKMVNGKPERIVYDDPKQNPQRVFGIAVPVISRLSDSAATTDQTYYDAYNLYTKSNVIEAAFPNLPLSEEHQSIKASTLTQLDTYIEENLSKLITGASPISSYDSYVSGFSKLGVDKLLTIYNEAYRKYLSNSGK